MKLIKPEMTRLVSYDWCETLKFLSGIIDKDNLIELVKIITEEYFDYKYYKHKLSSVFVNQPNPFIGDIIIAGKCIYESRIKEHKDPILEDICREYAYFKPHEEAADFIYLYIKNRKWMKPQD